MSCEKNSIGLCGDSHFKQVCPSDCPKLAIVQRLQALTDNHVTVSFDHNTFNEGEREESTGHLWSGFLSANFEYLEMDDRKVESLEEQLVTELRRISDACRDLATVAEARVNGVLEAVA